MSDGASTTQISERSRRASEQKRQSGSSAEVEALAAEADALLDLADRLGQRQRLLGGHPQQVEREPLRRALADAGQPRELGHQVVDRRREHRPRRARARQPEPAEPAGDAAHALLLQRGGLARRPR